MNEQSRINAIIAYFFLGPLFLLVRSDTPINTPYVRGHAKRASAIMGMSGIITAAYYIFISPLVNFQIFTLSLHSIILTGMMSILSLFLIQGAYRAYSGIDARDIQTIEIDIHNEHIVGVYTEEEKKRILASFIPFVGIFLAKKYPAEPYITGRKVGGLFAFTLITLIVFFGGTVSSLVFLITIIAIAIFMVTGVDLFIRGEFLELGVYKYIPTYSSIEAHISSALLSFFDFIRVVFGGEKSKSYKSFYTEKKELYEVMSVPSKPFIINTAIISIPGINILTIPSLFGSNTNEYKAVILQGLVMTIMLGLIIWLYGLQSPMALYLIFPSITLLAYAKDNVRIRCPFTSWVVSLYFLMNKGQQKIGEIGEQKEEVIFKYQSNTPDNISKI